MTVKSPTVAQLRDIASDFNMSMTDEDLASFRAIMAPNISNFNLLESMPDEMPVVEYPRTPGYTPSGTDNEYNAWWRKAPVKGAKDGPLKGRKVVLKDNIALAGVPMMNGSTSLRFYTPDIDATVVTRILEAGGEIAGKAHCEFFCFAGGSHTNGTNLTVQNPYREGYTSGGSSSGCAALVGGGVVEMAIGGDQGGSIRCPSSWCGVVGMKATHGLVPYTGAMPIEMTLDYLGPMTKTVADNALLLEVIAGEDGLDPRQYAPRTEPYTEALGRGIKGLKIGVVRDAFAWDFSEADVDAKVREAADRLASLGAVVRDVDIPMHRLGPIIWGGIALPGSAEMMMKGNGFGSNWRGLYATTLMEAHSNWRNYANEFPDSVKLAMLVGEYMNRHYRGYHYAKAQNLSRKLRAAYDDVLGECDLLLMPTNPMKATPIPPADAPRELNLQRAFEMVVNTPGFDATGHPAMSVPCGMSEGLPVGMMLVAKHYEESRIYQAAAAFEKALDWKTL